MTSTPITTIYPEGIAAVAQTPYPGWQLVTFTVDSGASETVMGVSSLDSIPTVEGHLAKIGVKYEVANGEVIPNLGEKRFLGTWFAGEADGVGITRPMVAQVTSVNKSLLSVGRLDDCGYNTVFAGNQSYIEDRKTKERMKLNKVGTVYTLELWVQDLVADAASGFARPGPF